MLARSIKPAAAKKGRFTARAAKKAVRAVAKARPGPAKKAAAKKPAKRSAKRP
jgi:hypothetical protein